jgi:chromosomal replication initiator protein
MVECSPRSAACMDPLRKSRELMPNNLAGTVLSASDAWKSTLAELEMQLTKATFDTWLRQTSVISFEDGQYVIGVRSGYAKDWLEHRLRGVIQRVLSHTTGRTVAIEFVVMSEASSEPPASLLEGYSDGAPSLPQARSTCASLSSRYHFSNFVVGNNNRLAHAASLAVAGRPAHAYNPLFIHGGVGLGKTHLLHAIGNECMANGLQVSYVSSEQFTNDLVNSIRTQSTEGFRNRYRTLDVLLIDDIQFIAGKESTQEEFFHTFNTLHAASKQIVLSSDRPPRAIITLEERLRSRFEGGLIVDIQAPDFETRLAILRDKAAEQRLPVPDGVLELIAKRVQRNIRELQGALTRAVAFAELSGLALTLESAAASLSEVASAAAPPTVENVLLSVAQQYGLQVEDLQGKSRQKDLALARHVVMYLLREETGLSLPDIGQALGGRDHSTVIHGYEKIRGMIEQDVQLRQAVLNIREALSDHKSPVGVSSAR